MFYTKTENIRCLESLDYVTCKTFKIFMPKRIASMQTYIHVFFQKNLLQKIFLIYLNK